MSVTRWVRAENNAQTSGNYFVCIMYTYSNKSIYVGSCRKIPCHLFTFYLHANIIFSMVMYNTAMFNASVKSIVEEPILVYYFMPDMNTH